MLEILERLGGLGGNVSIVKGAIGTDRDYCGIENPIGGDCPLKRSIDWCELGAYGLSNESSPNGG